MPNIAALLLAIFSLIAPGLKAPPQVTTVESQQTTTPLSQTLDVWDSGIHYRIYAVHIPDEVKLRLVPNFEEKAGAAALVAKYSCSQAINGGFYQQDSTPLGLFLTEGKQHGHLVHSNLVTGYFSENAHNQRTITGEPPKDFKTMKFILQTGPLFAPSSRLHIIDDKPARRSLLVRNRDNNLFMVAITESENLSSGPKLASLPQIFSRHEVQSKLPATTILNLDGGAASFFYTRDGNRTFTLSEITSIGSLFCVYPN